MILPYWPFCNFSLTVILHYSPQAAGSFADETLKFSITQKHTLPFNSFCGLCCLGLLLVLMLLLSWTFQECTKNMAIKFGALQNSGIPRRGKPKSTICKNTLWKHMLNKPCYGRIFHYCLKKNFFLLWKSNKLSQGLLNLFHTTPFLLICWKSIIDSALALLCFMPKTIWSIMNLLCKGD